MIVKNDSGCPLISVGPLFSILANQMDYIRCQRGDNVRVSWLFEPDLILRV